MSIRSTSATSTPGHDLVRNLARGAVLVAIASVAATAVWMGTRSDAGQATASEQNQGAASHAQAATSAVTSIGGSEQVAPATAAAAPAEGVALPTGANQTDGYPTGFPYTDLGAVALQVELAKAQIGFDYDQAASVARLYGDPEHQAVFEDRSRDAVAVRRQQADIPTDGEVPAPASYALTPVAYTLKQVDTDYYVVNLLSYVTLTSVGGQVRDGLYAGTQLVRWVADPGAGPDTEPGTGNGAQTGGDWKVVQGSSTDIQQLLDQGQPHAAEPGTPEFEQAGWIPINITGTAAETIRETTSGTGESS